VPGNLTPDDLKHLVLNGEIDTVLVAFPDLQGRLMGKRVTASFFLDQVARSGMHACAYLLTVDVDMNPLPGYRLASWATGYQDFHAVCDVGTLRRIPWLEKTALILCDLVDHHGDPVEESPRRILARQVERAAAAGYRVLVASELEFVLFKDSYEVAKKKRYADLEPIGYYAEDYHIFQTTKEEWVHRDIRNGMLGAGIRVESSKGEWSAGQQEMNLVYGEPIPCADDHVIYKNGAKEIAAQEGKSITFMAKYDEREGNSCHVHLSLRDRDGTPLFGQDDASLLERFIAGLLATLRDLTLFLAPNVNSYKRFAVGSFAPTAVAWGVDNRTCALRVVGHGPSRRVECRLAGADVNPYLAIAALIAGGLHGVDHELPLEPAFEGNAYLSDKPRVPSTLREASELFDKSPVAREAFGDEVVAHYLNNARVELEAFEAAVTDWERFRGFERL